MIREILLEADGEGLEAHILDGDQDPVRGRQTVVY